MKKVLYVVLISLTSFGLFAQQGEKSVGLNLGYGTDIKSFSIGAKFNYGITDQIRLSPSFNYYFEKDGAALWDLNADVHYLFPIDDKLTVYPLGGLSLIGLKMNMKNIFEGIDEWIDEEIDGSSTSTSFGLNLGGGIGYKVTDNISIGSELKYSISDFNQVIIMANVTYKF